MKLGKSNNATVVKVVTENLNHIRIHNEGLTKLYPDLGVVLEGSSLGDDLVVDYYSTSINVEVDEVQLNREDTSTYVYIHAAHPYKNVKIPCDQCDGLIRVNALPSRIPLFIEMELVYRKDFSLYGFLYEEILKLNNFSPTILSKIQMYVLAKLEEHSKSQHKIDISNMNNSIKKLLPFT